MSRLPIIGVSARFKAQGPSPLAGACTAGLHADRVGMSWHQRQANLVSFVREVVSAPIFRCILTSCHLSSVMIQAQSAGPVPVLRQVRALHLAAVLQQKLSVGGQVLPERRVASAH